jgi:hypothetical protein
MAGCPLHARTLHEWVSKLTVHSNSNAARGLWFSRGLSWRGIAAVLVEFGDALKQSAAVGNRGFGTEYTRTFEVENAERGEIILNQIVDGSHGCVSKAVAALLRNPSTRRKAASSTARR